MIDEKSACVHNLPLNTPHTHRVTYEHTRTETHTYTWPLTPT